MSTGSGPGGSVRIRVLGATELEADGEPVHVSSERQRRLLAALTIDAPEVVSNDRLAEAVWGDQQPDNAANALRTLVTRLRHTLDTADPDTGRCLRSRRPGYLLDVPPDRIDANRFGDLAAQGRRELASGDAPTASATLQAALDEWGGRPYAEFEGEPWVDGEIARLQRVWFGAREAVLETRLQLGQHADAVADIDALVTDEPFSDGPRALLMRALFAGGRQAEALRVFHDYRQLLADELGLEPGPELVELEARVLANDPSLIPESGRPLRGYRLHERISTTGRGEVFRATQPVLERDVAIEMIDGELADDPAFVRTFEQEGRALAQLGHANVVPVHDCWREPGGAYLVRALLTGGTLADADVRERLGPEGLARVRAQVRSALDVAHQAGLVHGPLDLSDVVLDDHDTAYLANFRLGGTDLTVAADDASFDRLFDALIGPSLPDATPIPTRVGNPYRGLAAFHESDVDVFFGRDRLVRETLDVLGRHGAAVVVGPSGSGKSSLVRAGVIPALRADELDGSAGWYVITMVPGHDPFAELAAAVLRVAVHPPTGLADDLRDPGQPMGRTIGRLLPEPDAIAVLVIDQLEELFTLVDTEVRDRFLQALGAAVREPRSSLRLLATLRADFYDQPLEHGAVAGLVKQSTVAVDALSGDELRAAIVEPALAVGVEVAPDLEGRLVADASARPGTLPMLQFCLTALFAERDGPELTLDAYLALGGLTGAVGERAEQLYEALDDRQRGICRRVFGRLVTLDASDDTRRRAPLAELRAAEARSDDLAVVLDRFVAARMLATDRDRATREPTIEVAHEALFREWPRLSGWIGEDRHAIATVHHLRAATQSWHQAGDDSELYRGARLAAALDLVADHGDRLTADELAFVEASRELAEAQERRQRRINRRLQGLLAAAAVLLVLAIVAGAVALAQRNRADDRAGEAQEQSRLAAEAAAVADLERLMALGRSAGAVPQEVAILAALEAHRIDPSAATLEALHWALTVDPGYRGTMGDSGMGGDITVLDDGRRIVTHTIDTIEIWDVETRTREVSWPFPGGGGVVRHTVLQSTATVDGTLLIASAPGVTTIIDAATGAAVGEIEHVAAPLDVAVSSDGRRLATAFDDGTTEVRELPGVAEPIATFTSDAPARAVRWHPDGELALGTAAGEVVLWDPDTEVERWRFRGEAQSGPLGNQASLTLLFSSDGARLVVADLAPESSGICLSTTAELDSRTGDVLTRVPVRMSSVRSLSWLDSTETTVVTSGLCGPQVTFTPLRDGAPRPVLRVANFETSAALPALGLIVTEAGIGLDVHSVDESNPLVRRVPVPEGYEGNAGGVVDPTGERLVANFGLTGTQVIDLDAPDAGWRPFTGPDGGTVIVGLGLPDGSGVLTAEANGWAARDWDGNLTADPVVYSEGRVSFAQVSPDSEHLMLTIDDVNRLFALGPPFREVAPLPRQDREAVCCATPAFSADGAVYSRLDREGGTEVFDPRTGETVPFDHELEVHLFGPAGTWFATVDDRGTIHLHDQATGERIGQPMVGNRGPITSLTPTMGGRRIAAVGADGTVRVWDTETTTQVGRAIEITHPGMRTWSADGRYLVASHVGDDGINRVEVWDFDTDTWPELACETAGRNLTADEWAEFGPRTIERRATCPRFGL